MPSSFPRQLDKLHNSANRSASATRDKNGEQVKHQNDTAPCEEKEEREIHQNVPPPRKKKDDQDTVSGNEYIVGRIVQNVGQAPDVKYVERLYRYSAERDTMKPSKHTL